MPEIPEPRAPHEHIRRCTRHHVWMPHCPDCAEWHRDLLKHQREEAEKRGAAT